MKNSAYRNSKIKHQLNEKRRHGVKDVVWKLTEEQALFIERDLHYKVEPYLYEVRTRPIEGVQHSNSKFLKDIHFKNKKGIGKIVLSLTEKSKALLDECEIKYKPFKFKIYLNG